MMPVSRRATPHRLAPLLVAACWLLPRALLGQNPTDLTLDFKPYFPDAGKYPLLCAAVEQGAVTLEQEDFVQAAPALRVDCSKTGDRVVGIGCYIHPNKLDPYRGQRVLFRGQVKWLSGTGRLTLQMRASGERVEGTISTQTSFEPVPGAWTPFALHATVPPMPEVQIVNFMVWLENSADPPLVLVDELRIEADTAAAAGAQPSGFAAYELPPDEPLVLVRDRQPLATIVIAEAATRCVRFAAAELNTHLQLSTGAELPIVVDGASVTGPTVHIGSTSLTERLGLAPRFLAPDHWIVQRVGDALILSGGDNSVDADPTDKSLAPFGSLYATYEFLERVVGVRWYWPGKLGTVVPRHQTLSVGAAAWYGAPTYQTRFAFYSVPRDDSFTAAESRLWWRRMRWGGVGGSPIGMHSFNQWPERFGDTHPEWFALQRNGQRAAHDPGGYVCFSNPEVFNQTLADVRTYFDEHPETRYRPVMPGDGVFECMCPACQAQADLNAPVRGRWSNYVWGFVNRIAEQVRQSHPDRIITCCAYSQYREPPTQVYLLPNVAVTLCTNYLPHVWRANAKSDYLAELTAWASKTDMIYVWDYWYARRQAGVYGAPSIFPRAIKEWFALERGRVKGRVIELCEYYADGRSSHDWADWMYDALDMYVAMKLMWNLDQDVEAMLAEYFTQLYGPAAPLVERFYTELERAWSDPSTKGDQWDWSTCWVQTYPPELVQRTIGYLREAERLTRGQEPWHARVAKTLEGFLPFEVASQRYTAGASAPVRNQQVLVPATEVPPLIDGRLDDACWQSAAVAEGFFDMFNSPDLHAQTSVRIVRDAERLYFAFRAALPDGVCKQSPTPGTRDGRLWETESCELFLVQDKRLYQFLIGPGEVFADSYQPDTDAQYSLDLFAWNCAGATWKTALAPDEWTAELALPLTSLQLAPPSAQTPWRVNFCRNYYYRLPGQPDWQWEPSAWRPPFGSFHNIERFGMLYFQ